MRVMAEATMTREAAYDLYHLDRSPYFYEVVAHVDNLEINHIPSRDMVSYDMPAGGVARSAQRPRPPQGTAINTLAPYAALARASGARPSPWLRRAVYYNVNSLSFFAWSMA
jgi:hypothetical protein